jgi:hypothetical protein
VQEIAAKFADALSMFWLALDEQERRLLLLGAAWLVGSVALAAVERQRKEREQEELVERVVARLHERGSRG